MESAIKKTIRVIAYGLAAGIVALIAIIPFMKKDQGFTNEYEVTDQFDTKTSYADLQPSDASGDSDGDDDDGF